jgi:hypothetical protein
MSGLPPWNFVNCPDPLIQRIGMEIGYPELVVDIRILAHQAIMEFSGLDPPLEPDQGQVIAREFQHRKPGDPRLHMI